MSVQSLHVHVLPNGLTLLIETMRAVQSAAFTLAVPAGVVFEDEGAGGTAAVLSDLLLRGAGECDSRELSDRLDVLGLQRHETVGTHQLTLGGATLAQNVLPALRLYADILRRPHLPADQFPAALARVEQSVRSIEDEPRQKVMIELQRRSYDAPWGRPTEGDLSTLQQVSLTRVQELYQRGVRPNGAILAVAGNVNVAAVLGIVEDAFGDWRPGPQPSLVRGGHGPPIDHVTVDSTQTQIGIAYPAVPYRHEDYYAAWAAVSVLSGGSSSRLFTEVRERRGLCYSVFAMLHSQLTEGRVLAYAGTTAERAQETLDVTLAELQRLSSGIERAELERCKAGAKSALIMQQESTASRASAMARDWLHRGRVVPLEEVHQRLDALSVADVNRYVQAHPADNVCVLTIGPAALEVPRVVS